jgi:hypothetical protein
LLLAKMSTKKRDRHEINDYDREVKWAERHEITESQAWDY